MFASQYTTQKYSTISFTWTPPSMSNQCSSSRSRMVLWFTSRLTMSTIGLTWGRFLLWRNRKSQNRRISEIRVRCRLASNHWRHWSSMEYKCRIQVNRSKILYHYNRKVLVICISSTLTKIFSRKRKCWQTSLPKERTKARDQPSASTSVACEHPSPQVSVRLTIWLDSPMSRCKWI